MRGCKGDSGDQRNNVEASRGEALQANGRLQCIHYHFDEWLTCNSQRFLHGPVVHLCCTPSGGDDSLLGLQGTGRLAASLEMRDQFLFKSDEKKIINLDTAD
jgi:hypothetical protein